MGHGLQEGSDMTIARSHLLRYKNSPQKQMVLGMLLQGAFWPKLRRQGAQADVAQAVCPRCHDFIEDSCHCLLYTSPSPRDSTSS
eukprot:9974181-Prorocentrum_lima.AAC.1